MSVISPTLPDSIPPPARKRWTRDECAFLENAGLLKERYELLDGEVVLKMGQNRRHATAVMLVIAYLIAIFGSRRVQTQVTMEVRADDRVTNRPEPDLVVLREDLDRVPAGSDALLAVEVSDTTQADDFGHKVALYARAGVAEYWALDLPTRRLTVFRRPDADTRLWAEKAEYTEAVEVAPLSAPDRLIRIADLLP